MSQAQLNQIQIQLQNQIEDYLMMSLIDEALINDVLAIIESNFSNHFDNREDTL